MLVDRDKLTDIKLKNLDGYGETMRVQVNYLIGQDKLSPKEKLNLGILHKEFYIESEASGICYVWQFSEIHSVLRDNTVVSIDFKDNTLLRISCNPIEAQNISKLLVAKKIENTTLSQAKTTPDEVGARIKSSGSYQSSDYNQTTPVYPSSYQGTNYLPVKSKPNTFLMVLLWIFLLPIMLIITIAKSNRIKPAFKAILIILILVVSISVAVNNPPENNRVDAIPTSANLKTDKTTLENKQILSTNETTTEIIETTANEKETYGFKLGDLSDSIELADKFVVACQSIGIDTSRVKGITKIDDWNSGPRYRFSYDNMSLLLYANADSTINSITHGDVQIYSEGLEPLSINDFIIDVDTAQLNVWAEDAIKNYLNYPATAKYSWNWAYGRYKEKYMLSNTVTAKNAFDVEEELPFYIEFVKDNDKMKIVYITLGGNKVYGDKYIIPDERKEIIDESADDSIVISEGIVGEYGKNVEINGENYIWYHIPEGTYEVIAKTNNAMIWISKNELTTNSDGYKESVMVNSIKLSTAGDKEKFDIFSDEHLLLVINTKVELVKIN